MSTKWSADGVFTVSEAFERSPSKRRKLEGGEVRVASWALAQMRVESWDGILTVRREYLLIIPTDYTVSHLKAISCQSLISMLL